MVVDEADPVPFLGHDPDDGGRLGRVDDVDLPYALMLGTHALEAIEEMLDRPFGDHLAVGCVGEHHGLSVEGGSHDVGVSLPAALHYAQGLAKVATDAGWTDAKEKYPSEAYSDYVLEDPETGIVMTVEARGSSDDSYLFALIYKAGQLG